MKYTAAYVALHIIIQSICCLKLPRALPMKRIATAATQLQSDGKVIAHTAKTITAFSQCGKRFESFILSSTRPHASDHATLV